MRFIISSSNIKVFAKSVITLSKFGDEIYFEPFPNSVSANRQIATNLSWYDPLEKISVHFASWPCAQSIRRDLDSCAFRSNETFSLFSTRAYRTPRPSRIKLSWVTKAFCDQREKRVESRDPKMTTTMVTMFKMTMSILSDARYRQKWAPQLSTSLQGHLVASKRSLRIDSACSRSSKTSTRLRRTWKSAPFQSNTFRWAPTPQLPKYTTTTLRWWPKWSTKRTRNSSSRPNSSS